MSTLAVLLQVAAIVQFIVALLNLALTRIVGWQHQLQRVPPLMREVFHVHSWFVSLTVAIFAVLTWRFASAMVEGSSEPATWLAAAIGIFWGVRTMLQIFYYSPSHWRGRLGPKQRSRGQSGRGRRDGWVGCGIRADLRGAPQMGRHHR